MIENKLPKTKEEMRDLIIEEMYKQLDPDRIYELSEDLIAAKPTALVALINASAEMLFNHQQVMLELMKETIGENNG